LVGLAVGAVAAAVKMVQGRMSGQPAPSGDWAPIPNTEPVVVPTAPQRPTAEPRVETHEGVAADAHVAEVERQPDTATPDWTPPAPAPKKAAAKKPAPAKKKAAPWIEPVGDTCPTSHPVKAKLASKIFHLPGGLNYARTHPDRCYLDAAAAEADGLRQSKR
jgi:hypothetical protein